MVYKKCPFCKGLSYSASGEREWICPYCRKDITMVEVRPARSYLKLLR